MFFETQFKADYTNDSGDQVRKVFSLLVDAMTFTEAESRTYEFADDAGMENPEVTAIKMSRIKEVVNSSRDGSTAYKVTLESEFTEALSHGDFKIKKMKNVVLVWADTIKGHELPDTLVNYLKQIDEGENTFTIVGINETKIIHSPMP